MAGIEQYLQELDEQVVQEESEILVVQNPVVGELCESFQRILLSDASLISDEDFPRLKDLFDNIKCTAKEIKTFSMRLKEYERDKNFDYWSGMFLSLLINNSSEENFEILIGHLNHAVHQLCYKNTKNVSIVGRTGGYFAERMKSGKIQIKGNCEAHIGMNSKGGEIYVYGHVFSVDTFCKAKVYQNGERVLWQR